VDQLHLSYSERPAVVRRW